jgi:flagellar basal body rod protein FlgG
MRVLFAFGLVAAGLGGCASQPQWVTTPVTEPGPIGERASELAKLRVEWAVQNLANVDTPGYRGIRVIGPDVTGNGLITQIDQSQGTPYESGSQLDLMVNGPGFFRLMGTDGFVYTRCGRFTRNADGEIVWAIDPSLHLEPPITLPDSVISITVLDNGTVSFMTLDAPDEPVEAGQIQLSVFLAPERLLCRGVLFWETAGSGCPIDRDPSTDNSILQMFYESSNVYPERERMNIERARRMMSLWAIEPTSHAIAQR